MDMRMISRILYPNWLSADFCTQGWAFFFSQETYPLSVLIGALFLWQYFIAGFTMIYFAKTVAIIVAVRRILAGGLCTSTKRLDGQTVIITGANVGIGKETARDLLRRGARVILACRSIRKAEAARDELRKESSKVEVRQLDLSSLKSVREFASGIIKDNIKLHILINNAGVMMCPYSETEDGFELHMGTNHLGHFLLTNLLLPQMKHGEPARIINVSSLGHLLGKINFDDFFYKENYDKMLAYCNSKLANVLFTRQLAKDLKGSNIKVFSLHPGAVHSDLHRHVMSAAPADYLLPLYQKTTLEGAQTTIYCATDAEQHKDMYFSDSSVGWVSPDALDDVTADKLWKLSAELVKLNK